MLFRSLQESASTVFNNEESTADDYANMANSLFKYVMNIYKGYESEDFTNELLNPGCDAESGSVVPDGWDIDKGNGNTYTGASQHYTVLLYESGSDEYTAAAANRYLDSWNGTAGSLIYTATSKFIPMEKGLHILKAVVRANGTGAYIFANTTDVEIPNFGDKDGDHGYGWKIGRAHV